MIVGILVHFKSYGDKTIKTWKQESCPILPI